MLIKNISSLLRHDNKLIFRPLEIYTTYTLLNIYGILSLLRAVNSQTRL